MFGQFLYMYVYYWFWTQFIASNLLYLKSKFWLISWFLLRTYFDPFLGYMFFNIYYPIFPLSNRWFHGRIKREEAENLLKPREDGLFLVRESTNFPGDYTLCVCFNEKVEHYRIKYAENKLTIDDDEYFDNLGQLVEVSSERRGASLSNCFRLT